MEYTAEITIAPSELPDQDTIDNVAELGGVCGVEDGGRRIDAIFTVRGRGPAEAVSKALSRMKERIAGEVLAVSVMTIAEADRRQDQRDELVGLSEIAGILEVSRQRVSQLSKLQHFPEPCARLAAGPVWRRADLTRFEETWQRKPGRPWPAASDA